MPVRDDLFHDASVLWRIAIERYAPLWKTSPALLVTKPHLGLIVSLEKIEHDERYFALAFAVEDAIVAPEGFDAQIPIRLNCVWNQPYMSPGADSISAPYSFYGSAREFVRSGILRGLRGFAKNDELGVGDGHSLCFQ